MCIIVSSMTANMQKIKYKQRDNFIGKLLCCFTNINSLFYYYIFLVLIGLVFFSTSLCVNYFTTPFTGDYVTQQYSFYTNGYDDWWHFFRTGEFIFYDTNTYLGVNNIGSNSFYYLFDPFFMPILLFPRQFVPQGMAILTIFKMALSGLVFYAYMRIMGASKCASKITGLAYAFSGWVTWYLWFNHFTGVAIAFPLILLGLEYVFRKKNPLILMSSVCLIGFINFFFMFCYVLCALFYGVFRYLQTYKTRSKKDNLISLLLMIAGFAVGILLPMMVVLPSVMYSISSPKASTGGYFHYIVNALKNGDLKKIFELLISWSAITNNAQNNARALYPFIEFIFPVTSCRGTPLTVYGMETYDNMAGSFYCFMPMLLLLFPAFRNSLKQKHYSVIIPLVFFIFALFTPCFYYLFFGFTSGYSRWTLFVVTSILAFSGKYLDEIKKEDNVIVLIESTAILIILILIGAFAAQIIVSKYGEYYKERFPIWAAALIQMLYLIILTTVLVLVKYRKKVGFYWLFTGFLATEISIMGALVIHGHGVENYILVNNGLNANNILCELANKTRKTDDSFYRSYSSLIDSTTPNDGMRNGYNGISTFHSLYNYNTADFSNWSSVFDNTAPMSWSGSYIQKRINVDTLLGVKYYYILDNYFEMQNRQQASSNEFRYNVPLNYIDITDEYGCDDFRVYKNADYIDFALTFDSYYIVDGNPVEKTTYSGLNYGYRNTLINEELYLRTAIINNYREKDVIHDLSKNHPDIHKYEFENRQISYYYSELSIGRYGQIQSSNDSSLTFYDFYSEGERTLDVNAETYLTLNASNPKYDKLNKIVDNSGPQRYVAVIESLDSHFPNYDPNGNIFYVSAPFEDDYGTDIYFVDIDNKIVTFDNHNDGNMDSIRPGKEERGFYISPSYSIDSYGHLTVIKDAPKIKKIICVSRESKAHTDYHVSIDTASSFNTKINNLKSNQVYDVIATANKYCFKTSFSNERIVVTRLAYEDGFKLIMTDNAGNKKDINVFNGQGGFLSFIAESGNCSYELMYETPNLKKGSLISIIGIIFYAATIVSYLYIDMRKKEMDSLKMN